MSDDLPLPAMFSVRECGWMKRPDLNTERLEVWEKPNGELIYRDPSRGELVVVRFPIADVRKWYGSYGA